MSQLPLAGLRVLDLGIITAGAGCSAQLADFGADVIKVESGTYPDPFRYWSMGSVANPSASLDGSAPFNATNRNKRDVCLDLKRPEGRDALLRLVAEADLVVENFRRGVLDRLGLGFEQLRAVQPRIVLISITSQGDVGPERQYGSYGSTLEAISGLMAVTGYGPERLRASGADVNYPDQHGALLSAGLVLAAVFQARRSGRGHHVVVSQREMVSTLVGEFFLAQELTGSVPPPAGNRRDGCVPHGVFPCLGEDQWVAIAVSSDAQWSALEQLIGGDATSNAYATEAGRRASVEAIESLVSRWTAPRTKHEVEHLLQSHGIPAAGVLTPEDRVNDPQFVSRGFFRTIEHPVSGPQRHRGSPFRLAGVELARRRAPLLGEHTGEVLAQSGFSQAEIAELDALGITRNTSKD
jgi:crotonobetainyl-CoA:carnitine CoA-transferase CaiB-like acyl-CoA transferase